MPHAAVPLPHRALGAALIVAGLKIRTRRWRSRSMVQTPAPSPPSSVARVVRMKSALRSTVSRGTSISV